MPGNGALLQLVAQGKQDIYLVGNPQVTWFKSVYRRYTNFAIESQQMYFDGDPDFGKRLTCLIPRRGDLLGPMMLEVTLPPLTLTDGTQVPYVNATGHALIEEISLEIGEQEIDKQTGEWMELWTTLSTPAGLKDGFNAMINKVDGAAIPPQPAVTSDGNIRLYIPLQFWFNRNPGQYLPLLALQYHPVRINLKLRSLQEMFYSANIAGHCQTTAVNTVKIQSLRLWGDYVFLDVEERRRFVANSQEYVIEQVQYTPKVGIPAANTTATVRLEFNHPLKEMIWVLQRDVMESYHEWFNYSSTALSETGLRRDLLQDAYIQIDGFDRFDARDAGYFRLVQPWQRHTNIPLKSFLYLYSFALRPEDLQPSGSLNASRIDNMVLQMTIAPDSTAALGSDTYVPPRGNAHVRVYALNHNVLRVTNGFGGLVFRV